jgi:hypothetical protein
MLEGDGQERKKWSEGTEDTEVQDDDDDLFTIKGISGEYTSSVEFVSEIELNESTDVGDGIYETEEPFPIIFVGLLIALGFSLFSNDMEGL